MSKLYNSIDDYINSFPEERREKLQELRKIILEVVPPETKEIINYGIPTFKWNGNLIHFAQAKDHIGIYPGPPAIVALKDELENFNLTKGTIKIPLDIALPKLLIQKIVKYNIQLLQSK